MFRFKFGKMFKIHFVHCQTHTKKKRKCKNTWNVSRPKEISIILEHAEQRNRNKNVKNVQ
jgi:hypothetical protein